MAFRFLLAPVLKLRKSLEERELHVLEQTQQEIARTVHLLDALRSEQQSVSIAWQRELAIGVAAASLHFSELNRCHLREYERALVSRLAELHLCRKQQMAIYEEAKRKRQMLSELRDQKLAAYESEMAHRAQRNTDDSFLARSERG